MKTLLYFGKSGSVKHKEPWTEGQAAQAALIDSATQPEAKIGLEKSFFSCPLFVVDENCVQHISSVSPRGIKHLPEV
jgi:hypothetical protein